MGREIGVHGDDRRRARSGRPGAEKIEVTIRKNIGYTLAVSAVAAMTGQLTDPFGARLTAVSGLSGALFLAVWLRLAYEMGEWHSQPARVVLLLYWAGLSGVTLLLDRLARGYDLGGGLGMLRELTGALLFSANYLLSWLCQRVGVDLWWSVGLTGLALAMAGLLGDARSRQRGF